MDAVTLLNQVFEQATIGLVPALLALAGLALRVWIVTHTRKDAQAALLDAFGRAAAVAAASLLGGAKSEEAVRGMVEYVERGLPGAVAKLKPQPGALAAMAEAVLLQRLQERADRRGDAALPEIPRPAASLDPPPLGAATPA